MDNFNAEFYCEKVIEFAKQFNKNFSYKPDDIKDMDEILEIFHNDYINEKISDELVDRIAVNLGIYLGQIMLDNGIAGYGFRWSLDGNELCLEKNKENKIYPLSKVKKRIVNGSEDSVYGFYDVSLKIAEKYYK